MTTPTGALGDLLGALGDPLGDPLGDLLGDPLGELLGEFGPNWPSRSRRIARAFVVINRASCAAAQSTSDASASG